MGFPSSFSSTTIVGPPDPRAPVASVLDYLENAIEEYDGDVTFRGDGFFEFKVPVISRVLRYFTIRWHAGSISWPLSFLGAGSFSATELRDKVVVTAEVQISQFLATRVILFGALSGVLGALSGPIPAILAGTGVGLGAGAVSYALAKWEFGFWFHRLDRLIMQS